MTIVGFYDEVEDDLLKFAVIIAKYNDELVFCKHKLRDTLEFPGGKREVGENIFDTAKRELYEETGAINYKISPICFYSVKRPDENKNFGALYFADIKEFESELHSEIEKIIITNVMPKNWTYPDIQPSLFEEARKRSFL